MRIIKSSLALVLALILAIPSAGMRSERAKAASTFTTTDGFVVNEYRSHSSGYTIVGYTGKAEKIEIPAAIGEYNVTEIGKQAFKGKSITSVVIPGSVNSICAEAFMDCTSLESVTFTEAPYDYYGVSALKEYITLSDRIFAGCKKLKSIEFPYGFDFYDNKDDVFADSGLKYIKITFTGDTRIQRMLNNAPELETIDIVGAYGLSYLSPYYLNDIPKLKEINIWPDYSGSHDIKSRLDVPAVSDPSPGTRAYYENCPNLEYITFHVGSDYIGKQFQPITNASQPVDFEGSCVERANGNSKEYFVVEEEGTAVFSCPETKIRIRLVVGEGNSQKKDLKDAKVTLPADTFVYTGEEITPYAQLTYGDTLLVEDTDYTVKCEDNKAVGAAKITFTGKGDYTGSISADYYIGPDLVPVYLKKAVIAKKTAKLEWNIFKGADGYQVYYSTKKSKGYKKLYSGTDTSLETKTVKSGMFIKIRTYKKVGKKTYYSEWSTPVKVK
jgi:hypothetical protein